MGNTCPVCEKEVNIQHKSSEVSKVGYYTFYVLDCDHAYIEVLRDNKSSIIETTAVLDWDTTVADIERRLVKAIEL